jgi:hypothetical protein
MGCDYYIDIYLEIEHSQGISYYDLPSKRGYYPELNYSFYDSDNDDDNSDNSDNEKEQQEEENEYEKLYEMMKELALRPRKPVLLYKNNSFVKPKFETKYLPMIHNKLNHINLEDRHPIYEDTGSFSSLGEVITITKKEVRYDPYDRYLKD